MSQQQSIYDVIERQKQEGIELVFRHANTKWKHEAARQLMHVAQTRREFTSDDILMPLEERGITTGDNRAIAAILQAANRVGLITSTDTFVKCRRRSRHHAPIMVWRSNMKIKETLHGS